MIGVIVGDLHGLHKLVVRTHFWEMGIPILMICLVKLSEKVVEDMKWPIYPSYICKDINVPFNLEQ